MTGSNEPINPHLNWLESLINSDLLARLIRIALRLLKLNGYYLVDEIKNEIFLLIQNLVDSKKLDGKIIEGNLVLTKINTDGKQEPIISLEAWLRKVILNYLRGVRRRENRGNRVIPFDEYPDQSVNQPDYAETTELREKLTQLNPLECRILELCFFEDLSFRKMAVRLQTEGFPEYTVEALRKKKQRAIEKLRLIY